MVAIRLYTGPDGKDYRLISVAKNFVTGERGVFIETFMTVDEMLNHGCTYGKFSQFYLSLEEFKETFKYKENDGKV